MKERLFRQYRAFLQAGRTWGGGAVKRGTFHSTAGPESGADHFMGISLPGHGIGCGALGRAASGKTAHREVETSPKEMDRAAFPDKPGPEFLEHAIRGNQNPPESSGEFRVVGGVDLVLFKWNRRRANLSIIDSLKRGAHSDWRSPRFKRQELGSGALNPDDRQFGPADRHTAFPPPPGPPRHAS